MTPNNFKKVLGLFCAKQNSYMNMRLILFLLVFGSVGFGAGNSSSGAHNLNDLAQYAMDLMGINQKGSCKEIPPHLPEQSADLMMQRGFELLQKRKFCDAAGVFYEIRRQYPIQPYYKQAWIQMIVAYSMAEEEELVANWGNRFIETEMRGTPEAEEIHLLMLRVQYDKMVKSPEGRSIKQACQLLAFNQGDCAGTHVNLEDPIDSNRTLKSYLEKYSDGKYVKEVKIWELEAKNKIANHSLYIARYYESRGQLIQALGRYKSVNKWGPSIDAFEVATLGLIKTMRTLSKQVLDPQMISKEQMEILSVVETVSAVGKKQLIVKDITREEMSEMLYNQAKNIAQVFYEKFPKSEHAQQAISLF